MPRKRTRNDAEPSVPGGIAGRRENAREFDGYPATETDGPEDAELRTAGEWGAAARGTESGQSELYFTGEELKELRAGGSPDAEDR
jgi:hypothetical protein